MVHVKVVVVVHLGVVVYYSELYRVPAVALHVHASAGPGCSLTVSDSESESEGPGPGQRLGGGHAYAIWCTRCHG